MVVRNSVGHVLIVSSDISRRRVDVSSIISRTRVDISSDLTKTRVDVLSILGWTCAMFGLTSVGHVCV